MSYSITIGNAVLVTYPDDLSAGYEVAPAERDDAPLFPHDGMTGQGNGRHPSYTGWAGFVDAAGIAGLFGWQSELMPTHPGIAPIKPEHLVRVQAALAEWQATATKPPGFAGMDKDWNEIDQDRYDPILARLIWLEYWMRWALDSCERPAVENS